MVNNNNSNLYTNHYASNNNILSSAPDTSNSYLTLQRSLSNSINPVTGAAYPIVGSSHNNGGGYPLTGYPPTSISAYSKTALQDQTNKNTGIDFTTRNLRTRNSNI